MRKCYVDNIYSTCLLTSYSRVLQNGRCGCQWRRPFSICLEIGIGFPFHSLVLEAFWEIIGLTSEFFHLIPKRSSCFSSSTDRILKFHSPQRQNKRTGHFDHAFLFISTIQFALLRFPIYFDVLGLANPGHHWS